MWPNCRTLNEIVKPHACRIVADRPIPRIVKLTPRDLVYQLIDEATQGSTPE